jgi:hypothetical protein
LADLLDLGEFHDRDTSVLAHRLDSIPTTAIGASSQKLLGLVWVGLMEIELASTGSTAQGREKLRLDRIIGKMGKARSDRNTIHGRAFQ